MIHFTSSLCILMEHNAEQYILIFFEEVRIDRIHLELNFFIISIVINLEPFIK